MQQKRLLVFIPFLAMLFGGCVKEGSSDCPPEYNLEFLFEYTTEPDIAFTELIKSVDLLLFDADSYFLLHKRSDTNSLDVFQGMRFSLNPGTYYAVAWANKSDHSSFSDYAAVTKLFAQCYYQIAEQASDGGDPVFYAPYKKVSAGTGLELYEIHVLSDRTTVKQLDFVRAYRTINVWINGYGQSGLGEDIQPTINVRNLWSMYDFYLKPLNSPDWPNSRRNYRQQTHDAVISGNHYSAATFYSALGEVDNETDIEIHRTSDDQLSYTLDLKQFVEDNNITNTERIDILITFLNNQNISITVPQWTERPVQPGTH